MTLFGTEYSLTIPAAKPVGMDGRIGSWKDGAWEVFVRSMAGSASEGKDSYVRGVSSEGRNGGP